MFLHSECDLVEARKMADRRHKWEYELRVARVSGINFFHFQGFGVQTNANPTFGQTQFDIEPAKSREFLNLCDGFVTQHLIDVKHTSSIIVGCDKYIVSVIYIKVNLFNYCTQVIYSLTVDTVSIKVLMW